jgi:hypothetical protein
MQDMEALLSGPQGEEQDNFTPTDDANESTLDNVNIDIEDMSLDQIIEMYSQEIFNGYGFLVPGDQDQQHPSAGGRGVPFSSLQEQLEQRVSSSLRSALDAEKVRYVPYCLLGTRLLAMRHFCGLIEHYFLKYHA